MKKVVLLVYGLFGAVAVILGLASLLSPTSLSSDALSSPDLAHHLREQGASVLFVGLISFWCVFNYEQTRIVHYCLLVFAFALAAIHWFEFLEGNRTLASPLLNSVPFAILLLTSFFLPRSKTIHD
jgi:hypothetical protein